MSTGFIRAAAGNLAEADLINASTGAAFAGTVTVYVTLDNGTQTLGSVSAGVATSKGNGLYQYYPSAAESDATVCSFTFIGTGAVPRTSQYWTITLTQSQAVSVATGPNTVTVKALLIAALQRALSGGDLPAPEDMQMALDRLNDLIDAWKIEQLTVFTLSRVLWTLTSATSYTVGSTGTVVVDRPSNASQLHFGLLDTNVSPSFERGLVNYTEQGYRSIAIKGLTSPYPQGFYYNPTLPYGTLTPWPVPTATGLQGVLYAPSPALEVGINDVIALPPGYRRFYRDNLAVELAPDFDMLPSPALMKSADESKAIVKRANVRISELTNEAASLGHSSGYASLQDFYGGTL